MSTTSKYYTHSGTFSPLSIVYFLVFGIIGCSILGALYGLAIYYIPFVYLNVLITFIFGLLSGMVIVFASKAGKARNTALTTFFALVFGAFAWYVSWIIWIHQTSHSSSFILTPQELGNYMSIIAKLGPWSVFGWQAKGVPLYLIWFIEFAIIAGGAAFMAWSSIRDLPFCEDCKVWMDSPQTIGPLEPAADQQELTFQLERGDFSTLGAMKKLEGETKEYSNIILTSCDKCDKNHLLSLQQVTVTEDEKNKTSKDEKTFLSLLKIDSGSYQQLKSQW